MRPARVLLAISALVTLQMGAWAAFAPRSFYDDFPGAGSSWVADDGPYNEHLVRDFGSLNLAIGVLLAVAAWTLLPLLVRTAAAAYAVYGLPHLVYHLRHLDVYETRDKVGSITALVVALLATVGAAALLERRRA